MGQVSQITTGNVFLKRILISISICLLCQSGFAHAEISQKKWRFGIFGGVQEAPPSRVNTFADNGTALNFDADWEGKSLSMPLYYSIRTSYWDSTASAWEIDFTHSKVYAKSSTLTDNGLDHLQFTDGVNVLSLSRVWQLADIKSNNSYLPYVGLGTGVSLPYVEIIKSSNPTIARTMGYQFGGFSGQAQAGIRLPVNSNINAVFEYKITFIALDVETAASRSLKTNLVTNALNIGIEF